MLRKCASLLGKVLVLAEVNNDKISPATFSAITAASKIGAPSVLIAGGNVKPIAEILACTQGVEGVIVSEAEHYAHGLPEELAPLINAVIAEHNFTHVFAGTSAFGKNVIPRAAACNKCMPIVEVTAILDEMTFERQMYAGNVISTVKSNDPIKYCTIRGTAFERAAVEPDNKAASCIDFSPTPVVGLSTFVEDKSTDTDKPELTTAAIVISGGRGLKSAENFNMLYELAAPLKAAVGATRAVVDAGIAPSDIQVGQTGKTVAPELYLAVGVSGAIQHVAGMKDSKVIAVVNNDADAPFFQIADYGIVGDLFKVVPALTEKVKADQ